MRKLRSAEKTYLGAQVDMPKMLIDDAPSIGTGLVQKDHLEIRVLHLPENFLSVLISSSKSLTIHAMMACGMDNG